MKNFQSTIEIYFIHHQLSIKYYVPKLTEITSKYIKEHDLDLIFDIIKYKLSLFEMKEEKLQPIFFKCIKLKELFSLPVPVLYRIINKVQNQIDSMSEKDKKEFIEFLLDCLKEHGREGSALFSEINNKINPEEIIR